MSKKPHKSTPCSLQARSAALCLGVTLLGVVPSALFLLSQQREEGYRMLKTQAGMAGQSLATAARAPVDVRMGLLRTAALELMSVAGAVDYILVAPAGEGMPATLFLPGSKDSTVKADVAGVVERGTKEIESPHSGLSVMRSLHPLPSGGWVEVAVSMQHFETALAVAQRRTIYAGGAAVFVGLLCSFLFARRIARPLEELCGMAKGIASGVLSTRAEQTTSSGEISMLAANLNTMASRLEENQSRMLTANTELERMNGQLSLRFKRTQLLADISAEFLAADSAPTDTVFTSALGRLAEELSLEGACIFTRSAANSGMLQKSWEWNCLLGPICKMERVPEAGFPWAIAQIFREGVITLADTKALPEEARAERINLERLDITTAAGVALGTGEKPSAYLFLRGHGAPRAWSSDEEQFIKLAGGLFANAIARREAASEREILHAQLLQSQKMEAVGQLSGGIAHDFNNMLVPIIGYSDSILSQVPEGSQWSGEIREIKRAAESAAAITRRLLTFSRQQITTRKEMNLNEHIESVHKMLARLLGETIQLRLDLSPELWTVSADCSQVDQCLVNLAVNAKAAMSASGGTIRISTAMVDSEDKHFQPRPGAKSQGVFVRLSVEDTGCGMDAATIARIFEPFFSTKGTEGTGLGLSVVHGVMQDHGGWVTVDSVKGEGTSFRLWLPALNEPLPKPMDTGLVTAMDIPRGKGQTVLLIEDEPGVLAFVSAALRQNGYKMLTAASGAAAREIFHEKFHTIDLVMSDVVLPDASGVDLVEEFYAIVPSLRALLSSGYSDKQSLVELVEKRGLRFLHKPYTLIQLLESVHGALHGADQRLLVS